MVQNSNNRNRRSRSDSSRNDNRRPSGGGGQNQGQRGPNDGNRQQGASNGPRPQGGGGPRPQASQNGPRPQGQGSGSGQRRSRRRRSGRPLSPAQVVQKYLNLLEQHLTNRRKYYEDFNRDEGRHRRRLEKNFFGTIEQLRRFEERLDPRQKEALLNHVERYRLDLTYSGNRDMPAMAEPVSTEGDFIDPHLTPLQYEAFKAYAEDREESSGTYADYEAYKASK